jgi:hypothetical protein
VSVTKAPVPWKRYQTPPEPASTGMALHAAVGSLGLLVEPLVVPVTEPPHVKTGRLGAVHRSLAGGVGSTVKVVALVAVPVGVTTLIGPVVAPTGTVAVILVAELTVKAVAGVPLNCTLEAAVRNVPVSVTLVPTGPLIGVKLVRVGSPTSVRLTVTVADAEVAGDPLSVTRTVSA